MTEQVETFPPRPRHSRTFDLVLRVLPSLHCNSLVIARAKLHLENLAHLEETDLGDSRTVVIHAAVSSFSAFCLPPSLPLHLPSGYNWKRREGEREERPRLSCFLSSPPLNRAAAPPSERPPSLARSLYQGSCGPKGRGRKPRIQPAEKAPPVE